MKVSVTLATLAAVVSTVVAAPTAILEARQYGGDTYNQLTDGTPCRDITVGDPAAVGPLIFNALAGIVGTDRLAVQGVTYAANILGFLLGGDPTGARSWRPTQQRIKVPQHQNRPLRLQPGRSGRPRAAGLLSADVASKVSAVLTLGDPFQKRTLANIPASKWKVICHDGDSICTGGIIPNDPHTELPD
ncbi:hypothetical protein MCOR02_011328 [Pyricularia oryzae]|nr:hypothetical protein MCOR02_011328 [Pyricularia oryzae]